MHGTSRAWRKRRTLALLGLSHSGTTLEDRLSAHGHASRRPLPGLRRSLSLRSRICRRWRSGVNRSRSSLRSNQSTHWRSWSLDTLLLRGACNRSCRRSRWWSDLNFGNRGTLGRRRDHRSRSQRLSCCRNAGLLGLGNRRRNLRNRWRRRRKRWTNRSVRLDHAAYRDFWSGWRRRGHNFFLRWRSGSGRSRFGNGSRRHSDRSLGSGRRSRRSFGFLAQPAGYVTRLRDVREIDLGFYRRFARCSRTAVLRRRTCSLSGEVLADALGFIDFDGARVRLLLRHSDFGKDVENGLALDFQFPRQIVDSNLTHPCLCLSNCYWLCSVIPSRSRDPPLRSGPQ